MNELLDRRPDRKTTLVALGGGVVGDLTGFAAAVLLRGVDFIQVPTTLLAQVDSSVGGKTGINTRHGKNLVGAFYQPRLVLADTDVLDTLPRRELLAGYAEVAKYGLIDDPDFFAWCETNGAAVLAGDAAKRTYAIEQSCLAKARIVAADERETTDLRALLNLGHTFGHALEAETGFGPDLLHGEAVGAGMAMAFDLSARLGLCPAADAERVRRHLGAVGLPMRLRSIGGDNRRDLGRRPPDRPHARRQEGRGRQAHLHPGARHRQGLRQPRGRREGPARPARRRHRRLSRMETELHFDLPLVRRRARWSLLCLLLGAYMSAAETAITGVSRPRMHRLAQQGNKRAVAGERPARPQGRGGERRAARQQRGQHPLGLAHHGGADRDLFGAAGVVYATIIVGVMVVIFAEVMPKTWALLRADRVALILAPSIVVTLAILGPMARGVAWISRFFLEPDRRARRPHAG